MSSSSDSTQPADDRPPHTDARRWEALVQRFAPAMLAMIRASMSKALRTHHTAEDIWQETLTHAWRDRDQHQWRGEDIYRSWLFEIAENRLRDAARSLKAQKRGGGHAIARFSEIAGTDSLPISGMLPADSVTPSRIASRAEGAEAVRRALAELPPELEVVMRKYEIEELTMETIAAQLGIGISAAWRRYRKARELLSEWIDDGTGRNADR